MPQRATRAVTAAESKPRLPAFRNGLAELKRFDIKKTTNLGLEPSNPCTLLEGSAERTSTVSTSMSDRPKAFAAAARTISSSSEPGN